MHDSAGPSGSRSSAPSRWRSPLWRSRRATSSTASSRRRPAIRSPQSSIRGTRPRAGSPAVSRSTTRTTCSWRKGAAAPIANPARRAPRSRGLALRSRRAHPQRCRWCCSRTAPRSTASARPASSPAIRAWAARAPVRSTRLALLAQRLGLSMDSDRRAAQPHGRRRRARLAATDHGRARARPPALGAQRRVSLSRDRAALRHSRVRGQHRRLRSAAGGGPRLRRARSAA